MSNEQELPKNKSELLSQIETEWSALMDVVGKLNERQMTAPDAGGWSPKDNLAHISEWIKVMLGYHMDHRPSHEVIGVTPEVTANWDDNRINKILFERNRARSIEDVLIGLKDVYVLAMDRLKATPYEELLKPRFPYQPGSPSLLEMGILNNTRDHFAEHRETIEKVLEKKPGS